MKYSGRFLFILVSAFFSLITLAVISTTIFVSITDYDSFILLTANLIGKEQWVDFLRLSFPETSYKIAKYPAYGLSIALLVLLFIFFRHRGEVSQYISEFFAETLRHIQLVFRSVAQAPAFERNLMVLLIICVAVHAIYQVITLPMQYDEMWTSNYFVSSSIYKSVLLPGNNHIFFTLVASVLSLLHIDIDLTLRLPSVIAGIFSLFIFWAVISKYFTSFVALPATYFFSSSMLFGMYITLGRSYMFLILFSLFGIWAVLKMMTSPEQQFSRQVFFIASLLGYWSNPLFIYFHISLMLIVLFCCMRASTINIFYQCLKISILAASILAILYLPVFLSKHFENLLLNPDGEKLRSQFDYLYESAKGIASSQLGFSNAVFIYPLLLLMPLLVYRKNSRLFFWIFAGPVSFCVVLLFSMIQKKVLFNHLVIYLTIYTATTIALLIEFFLSRFKQVKGWSIALVCFTILAINMQRLLSSDFLYWSRVDDATCKLISEKLLDLKISNCYLQYAYFKPGLEYYYRKSGKSIAISMAAAASNDFKPFDPEWKYSAIIEENKIPLPVNRSKYHIALQNNDVTLWILN